MSSLELSDVDRISRRLHFVNNIDYWISESVYHRTNSLYFDETEKIVLQSLDQMDSKTRVK